MEKAYIKKDLVTGKDYAEGAGGGDVIEVLRDRTDNPLYVDNNTDNLALLYNTDTLKVNESGQLDARGLVLSDLPVKIGEWNFGGASLGVYAVVYAVDGSADIAGNSWKDYNITVEMDIKFKIAAYGITPTFESTGTNDVYPIIWGTHNDQLRIMHTRNATINIGTVVCIYAK